MSESDENELIGRLAKEYADAKLKRDLAAKALQFLAGELKNIVERMEEGAFDNARTLLRKQLIDEFGLGRLDALLKEEAEWSAKSKDLREELRKLHIAME